MPDLDKNPISSFWKGDMHAAGKKGAASRAATMAARTHCKHNHEYTEENTGRQVRGGREVRFCIQCYEDRKEAAKIGKRVEL